jgi:glucarate dehydratase
MAVRRNAEDDSMTDIQQATGRTPVVTEMLVVPVAGQDSMLLNLCGAHGPFFTRTIVILKDSAGNTGLGEVPGGEGILRTLERSIPLVVGQPIGACNAILNAVRASLPGAKALKQTIAHQVTSEA